MQAKAEKEGLANVHAETKEAESAVFCKGCADIIFYGTVLHDFRDPAQVLANAREMLAPGGKLVNLDWKKEPTKKGPPLAIRFSEAEAASLMEQAGLEVVETRDPSKDYYVIVARGKEK